MPSMDKLSNYATTVATGEDGKTRVTYHSTAIVTFDAESVVLDSGGYQTVTTKRKMNQAANQFGLGFAVYQRDFDWFVRLENGQETPFEDGLKIVRNAEAV